MPDEVSALGMAEGGKFKIRPGWYSEDTLATPLPHPNPYPNQ